MISNNTHDSHTSHNGCALAMDVSNGWHEGNQKNYYASLPFQIFLALSTMYTVNRCMKRMNIKNVTSYGYVYGGSTLQKF